MDINRLCRGCFHELPEGKRICPFCGFDPDKYEEERIPEALPPDTILHGTYLIGKCLGKGGFGITYIGYHLILDEVAAIKELFPAGVVSRDTRSTGGTSVLSLSGSDMKAYYDKALQSFMKEAKTLWKIDLPGVVNVTDCFEENRTAYIVMKYISGKSLKQYQKELGAPMREDDVLSLLHPTIVSLKELHSMGIIHRDISPDNLMLGDNGKVTLVDFGAARSIAADLGNEARSMTVVLKPGYAPMEQYNSRGNQGPWTDVYALCATMYKLMTGETPEEPIVRMEKRGDQEEILQPLRKSGVSGKTANALVKGMECIPGDRYQTMQELEDALYGAGDPVSKRAPSAKKKEISKRAPSAKKKEIVKPQGKGSDDHAGKPSGNTSGNRQGGKKGIILLAVLALIAAIAGGLIFKNINNQQERLEQRLSEVQKESQRISEAESQKESRSESEAKSERLESEAESRVEFERTESEAESRAEFERAESEAESRAESEAASRTESEAESRAESEDESEAESRTESEAESRTESEAESRTESESESRAESEAESEAESRTESEAESRTESEAESRTESEAESRTESEAESRTESEAESRAESERLAAETISFEAGDIITFGTYEQDNDTSNGPEEIEWIVLDVEGDQALVISKLALSCKRYNEKWKAISWKDCTLRIWLNRAFYEIAFDPEEQARIKTTHVIAEDNSQYGTDAGNDTEDKVFLLSISEAEELFADNQARACYPSEYAVGQGTGEHRTGNCGWWLRSPGNNSNSAACVKDTGLVNDFGTSVNYVDYCVRPALWIDLSGFKEGGKSGEETDDTIYTDAETVKEVQTLLNASGYDCGTPDGVVGDATNIMILHFKKNHGMVVNTDITEEFLTKLRERSDVPSEAVSSEIGNTITFGSYEQDNDTANGPEEIEWIVLDVEGDQALVISKLALSCKRYNEKWKAISWKDCTLRIWLNRAFYEIAFSPEEQARIKTTHVIAEDNSQYGTGAGNDTDDKVFLLSISEAEELFADNQARTCCPSEYAVGQGAGEHRTGNCGWWLRSPGNNSNSAACVKDTGLVNEFGTSVNYVDYCVRPAIWIDLAF